MCNDPEQTLMNFELSTLHGKNIPQKHYMAKKLMYKIHHVPWLVHICKSLLDMSLEIKENELWLFMLHAWDKLCQCVRVTHFYPL